MHAGGGATHRVRVHKERRALGLLEALGAVRFFEDLINGQGSSGADGWVMRPRRAGQGALPLPTLPSSSATKNSSALMRSFCTPEGAM